MIDELVRVADAMDEAGIVPVNWHAKLKVLPKGTIRVPCLKIRLTTDGHVKDVELLSKNHAALLRKYEPDLGRSLPGFNVRPLYRLVRPKDECRKSSKAIEDALKKGNFNWVPFIRLEDDFWAKTRDGLERCFGAVREELEKSCASHLHKGETLQMLFDAVKQIDVTRFQEEYRDALQRKIEIGELPLSLMFYFVTAEKKQREDSDSSVQVPKYSVFLDIADYHEYPVSHEKTIDRLNSLLMDEVVGTVDTGERDLAASDKDVYGLDAAQANELFPSVKLIPPLNIVILRSQAKTIPAQKRYHQCESNTFPVGAETRKRVKRALEYLADQEGYGKTYGIAGDQELLFAYPRVLPKSKIPFARLLGAQIDLGTEKFERLAKSVIEQLIGMGREAAEAELEIFSLRKMDKARTKVVYYRNATVASLEMASKAWHQGCRNIPLLDIRDWSKEKDEQTGKSRPVLVEGETVFPVKLHRYLNAVWKRNGERADTGKSKVNIFEPADGLRLLLEEPCLELAAHMMARFIRHAQGYFLSLCQSTGRREIAKLPDKDYYPGILGLLLFKSGKQKETFMKESAFLLGRFLRVADEIHRLYCEVVRKNDLPPELCGSAMLVSMMEAPGMTLSQLAMRSAPYVKWASAYHDDKVVRAIHGEEIKVIVLVKSWLRRWSELADQLHKQEWAKRLEVEERGQVFLGYLASFPKREETNDSKSNIESMSNQGE